MTAVEMTVPWIRQKSRISPTEIILENTLFKDELHPLEQLPGQTDRLCVECQSSLSPKARNIPDFFLILSPFPGMSLPIFIAVYHLLSSYRHVYYTATFQSLFG